MMAWITFTPDRRAASSNRADLANTSFCLTIAAKPKSLNAPFSWTISFSKSNARSAVCPLSIARAVSNLLVSGWPGKWFVPPVRNENLALDRSNGWTIPHVTYCHYSATVFLLRPWRFVFGPGFLDNIGARDAAGVSSRAVAAGLVGVNTY